MTARMTPNPNPSPELLPCPFCGGEADVRSTLDVPAYWFGICLSCETMTGYSTCAVGAAMTWNRRNEPRDEGTITDRQINDAIRHGFGDSFANDDQRDRVMAALNNLRANPSVDEIPLVLSEIMAILQPDVLRDRIAILERENRNYAKTMDIIGQLPATPTLSPQTLPAPGEVEQVKQCWSAIMREFGHAFGDMDKGYYAEVEDMRKAVAALSLATVAAANDEGDWVLVPREITQAMLDATCATEQDDAAMRNAWSELLSNAPKPPAAIRLLPQGEGK